MKKTCILLVILLFSLVMVGCESTVATSTNEHKESVQMPVVEDVASAILDEKTGDAEVGEEAAQLSSTEEDFESSDLTDNDNEFSHNLDTVNYIITVIDSSEVIKDSLPFENILVFPIIRIIYPDNNYLEYNLNASIVEASQWMSEILHYRSLISLNVYLQTNRFLSFVYRVDLYGMRADTLFYPITIDMQTGQRVVLSDLVDVNMDFIKKVIEVGRFVNCDPSHPLLDKHGNICPNWLLEQLEAASYTARLCRQ